MSQITDQCQDPNGCQNPDICNGLIECRWLKYQMMEEISTKRHGSPVFYKLIEEVADIHNKKSHDYASNDDPYANYKFAGLLSKLFNNSDDAGFIGRIGEKLYRLANLDNNNKKVLNESIEDTERDIVTITALWVAMRRERRAKEIF